MIRWKLNLVVLWLGLFLVMSGMTMIIPFLPYYIQELGIHEPEQVARWAGIIFAANFVTSFLFQPLWGKLADRYGRKIMLLRSGFGMAIVMILMGFSSNVWHLLALRLVNGVISGFNPAATALVAATTPKERAGFAMGVVQSGTVGGTILGPLIGGLMAGWVGYRPIFYITGTLILLATLLALFVVKEQFNAQEASNQEQVSIITGFKQLIQVKPLLALFSVTFVIQFAITSSMPLLPLFIQEMHPDISMIAFYAGLVGSVTGVSNMLASPILGRLGDRYGSSKILMFALIGSTIALIPQAFVHNVWQLIISRFFMGLFIGGLLPSVNALIRQYTPNGMVSRAFGFNTSFLSMGNMTGATLGGLFSGLIGIRGIFIVGAILMLGNALWFRWNQSTQKSDNRSEEFG